MGKSKAINKGGAANRPDAATAEEAVRTLIRWAGDDPDRPGMQQTPQRLLAFYKEFFTGYAATPAAFAGSIANDVSCGDFILVRDINLVSFCEHHMLPATGTAHIAYVPGERVPGLGAIARIADICARRFTTQETLTSDIAAMIEGAFAPAGIAVLTSLSHGCMALRAPQHSRDSAVTTNRFTGIFANDPELQNRFFMLVAAKHDRNT